MLFQPSNIYPSTFSGIGAGTVDVTQGLNVSWQVNGDTPMTAYQIKIYQNDSGSTLMYDSGSVTVSPAFEPHDKYGNATYFTAIISAAALSTAGIVNGYQYGYKMLITQWWGVSDYVEQTSASVFITRSTPTLAINTITTPVASNSLTITANYSQAQGDPISTVEWVFALAGSESTPIRETGAISTQVLSFDADGLITGNTYSIMCKVVTSTGMEASTGFVQFPVSYSSSSLGINYQLAQLKNSSAVYLSWDNLGSNILSYPYTDTTKTTNGITFTVNGEGDVVVTGTASADAYFAIAQGTLSQLGITAGQKFIVTSGYSGAKIVVTETNSSNVVVSTITGNDPLQYIATSTTNTLKFSIVIPSGTSFGTSQQLHPMIAIEDKIVALNDVSVTMQPIQDLHGYSSPWPAGGGKNKYDLASAFTEGEEVTTNGVTAKFSNGYLKITGTNNSGSSFNIIYKSISGTLGAGTYIGPLQKVGIRANVDGGGNNNYQYSFTAQTSVTLVAFYVVISATDADLDLNIPMMVVSGTTRPTEYSPYSNICPISGRTGVSVYDDPKYGGSVYWNQHSSQFTRSSGTLSVGVAYTKAADGKTATLNGTATANDFYQLINSGLGTSVPGHKYAVVTPHASGSVTTYWFYLYNRDVHDFGDGAIWTATSSVNIVYGVEIKSGASFNNLQIDIPIITDLTEAFGAGNEPTIEDFKALFYKDYYAYNAGETTCVSAVNGDPYWKKDIDWTSPAGTVYGGTVDVVTGVLTVTHGIVDMGSLSWSRNATYNVMYAYVAGKANGRGNLICSNYKTVELHYEYLSSGEISGALNNNAINVKDDAYTSAADFKTAMNGVQLVYELATPLTYQLTAQEVAALVGTNNVWSTGDSVSVTYTKDTGSQATLSGAIVTFSDSNAVLIPTPQYIPGITGISIYRYLQGEYALQHVYDLATGATSILDYYAPSQMQVSYLIVAHSGTGDLFLQTTKFTPTFWFFSILLCDTDSNGDYHVSKEYIFKYGVETGSVSNNNDPTIQKNFTPYPNRQPISTLYKTGKVSGYIGKTNNLNQYSDSISLQNAIYDISVSTLDKFLKSRKGDVIKVDTASSIQMKTEDNTVQQALKATVDWVEVGEASQVSIVSVPSDSFWPIS